MTLLPYQEPHQKRLQSSLEKHGLAIDGSDPGTGKTYVAAKTAAACGRPALVVCPKVSIPVWRRVLEGFGVTVVSVLNYEKLRTGNTPFGTWDRKKFVWSVPAGTLVIFDEVQRCKAKDSKNAMMLRDAKGMPLLLLSATLATNPMELRSVAHVTGLADWYRFWGWLQKNGCKRGRFGMEFDQRRSDVLAALHEEFFIQRGSRIRIADLGDQFPETQIAAEALDFGDEIDDIYKEMEAELDALAEAASEDGPAMQLTAVLRARQKVELCKVPGIVSMTTDFVDAGHSVVIFTNFRQSLETLCDKLKTKCAIYGDQSPEARHENIEAFQRGDERVIVVNIQAGGVSLSLHDTRGDRPRVALLCPTYSAMELRQALGRVHRAGGGKSLQRILFAANSVEEKVCARVNSKLAKLDLLNDGDLGVKTMNEDPGSVSILHDSGCIPTLMDTHSPTPTHAERPHSKHSPSSLENKAKCAGWFNNEDPNRDQTAAVRGTLGHEMVEKDDFDMAPDDLELTEAALKCREFMKRFIR